MGHDVMTSKKTYATRLDPDSAVAKKIEDSGNSAKFLEDTLNNVFADGHDPTKEKPLTQKIKEVQYAKLKQGIELNKLRAAHLLQKMDTEVLKQKIMTQHIEHIGSQKVLVDSTLHKITSGVIEPISEFVSENETMRILIFDTYIVCACSRSDPSTYISYSKFNVETIKTALQSLQEHADYKIYHERLNESEQTGLIEKLSAEAAENMRSLV